MWPLPGVEPNIPEQNHPGSFGAIRRYDIHTGVDLYCEQGQRVVACEDSIVVCAEQFTGKAAGSPWWNDTWAIILSGKHIICYGELVVDPELKPGSYVDEGQLLGWITPVLKKYKGKPMSMLHFEMYSKWVETPWWHHDQEKPDWLINPTEFLKTL